jgi:hypothetical protein
MKELYKKVIKWVDEKGIYEHSDAETVRENATREEILTELGDVMVCMINYEHLLLASRCGKDYDRNFFCSIVHKRANSALRRLYKELADDPYMWGDRMWGANLKKQTAAKFAMCIST